MATIIISVILVAIVALIIRGLIQDRKGGKSSCGGSCGSCGVPMEGNAICRNNPRKRYNFRSVTVM